MNNNVLKELIGKTLTSVRVVSVSNILKDALSERCKYDNNGISNSEILEEDELIFTCESGEKYKMFHERECCETVSINDIEGDLYDLIGHPIINAEEVTEIGSEDIDNTFTYTFYKFSTIKGYVTIRWYGESNGYYSEKVSFERIK